MNANRVLVIFCSLLLVTNCSVVNYGIFNQLSRTSVCSKQGLFQDFSLSEIPELNALCNIPVPNEEQVGFLFENNVVPILCMGMYDVLERLCEQEIKFKHPIPLEAVFPPSKIKFSAIFETLKKQSRYSNLTEFCLENDKLKISETALSNNLSFWRNVTDQNILYNSTRCQTTCRTNHNGVHLLCSFIDWSNNQILNVHKSAESMAKDVEVPDGRPENKQVKLAPEDALKSQQRELPISVNDQKKNPEIDPPAVQKTKPVEPQNVESQLNPDPKPAGGNKIEASPLAVQNPNLPATSTSSTNLNMSIVHSPPSEQGMPEVVEDPTKESIGKNNEEDSVVNDEIQPVENVEPENFNTDKENKGDIAVDKNYISGKVETSSTANLLEVQQQFEDDDIGVVDEEENIGMRPEKEGTKSDSNSEIWVNNVSPIDKGLADEDSTVLIQDPFIETEDTHFFTYFIFMSLLTIFAYLAFHNKNKLLALAVEGRRTKSSRRRPNSSNYSKLDCSLEEAMVSNTTASVTHVLY